MGRAGKVARRNRRQVRVTRSEAVCGNIVAEKRVDFGYNLAEQFDTIDHYADLVGTLLLSGSTASLQVDKVGCAVMTLNVPQLVRSSFQLVADKHKLKPLHEISDEQQYSIDFICDGFNLRLDRYKQGFYPLLYKAGYEDRKADLFNLLAYLAGATHKAPSSEFFQNETNIEAKYRRQLDHIASTLNNHYDEIAEFFRGGDIDSKFADLNRFMIDKYPHLFKRASDEK